MGVPKRPGTTEVIEGATPAGGVRSRIDYFKDGEPVDKAEADSGVILEYNTSGEVIKRTYVSLSQEGN